MAKEKSIKIPIKKIKTKKPKDEVSKDVSLTAEDLGFEVSHMDSTTLDLGMKSVTKGLIKVSFPKLVQLLAQRDFDEVLKQYEHEEVIIGSDLLVDLAASSHSSEPTELGEEDGRFTGVLAGAFLGLMIAFVLFLLFIN